MFRILCILLIFLFATDASSILGKRPGDDTTQEPRRSNRHMPAPANDLTGDEIEAAAQAELDYARTHTDLQPITRVINHRNILKDTIRAAKTKLLITSESITRLPKDYYYALKDAHDRGVTIIIYYNKTIPDPTLNFLRSISLIEKRNIHAKFLIMDDSEITIGSHNWLDFSHAVGNDKSFKISGNVSYLADLKRRINLQIREYGNISYALRSTDILTARQNTATEPVKYPLNVRGTSSFTLLNSLQAHNKFLSELGTKAKHRIDITSPHVNLQNAITRLENLAGIINPSAIVHLHVWDRPPARELKRYINDHPALQGQFQLHFLPEDHHNKTLIVDNTLIAEGSFNWLSTALTQESEYHNLDSTIVVEGPKASEILTPTPAQ